MAHRHYKIGAGILNTTFMESNDYRMYTAYQRIISQIEDYRCDADEYFKKNPINETDRITSSYKLNKTISIVGDRGVGKTSLLLTIMNYLQDNEEHRTSKNENIILPTIDPDKFNAEQNALGWVIFLFEKILSELDDCGSSYCTEKQKDYISLEKTYNRLKENYINSRENSRREMSGFVSGKSEYSNIAEKVLFSDMNLSNNLYNFFSELVKHKTKYSSGKKQPLIFITFDDIDLCPEHGMKIINTILEYLSHPAVVTIVLGKIDNFTTGIENIIMKTNKIYDSENDRSVNKENSTNTTLEILKKGLPPIFRSYIRKPSFDEILNFIPYGDEIRYPKSLKDKLYDIDIDKSKKIRLIDFFDLENSALIIPLEKYTRNYWLKFADNSKSIYSIILPQIPRDAINFYYMLDEIIEIEEGEGEDRKEKYFDRYIIFYDYYYNLLEYRNRSSNCLDEIFQIDRKRKKISIKNKFNSIVCYSGTYSYYLERKKDMNDNMILNRGIKHFLDNFKEISLSKFLDYQNSFSQKFSTFPVSGNMLDQILVMINDREYSSIHNPYFKPVLDEFYESIKKLLSTRFLYENLENEQDIQLKNSIDVIMFTLNIIQANTQRYFNYDISYSNKQKENRNDKELVKKIKEDIDTIKSEIIKLEIIVVKAEYEIKSQIKERDTIEIENDKYLNSGLFNLKFYDEINKKEIKEEDGIMIQFMIDIAIQMGLLDRNSMELIRHKITKATDGLKKKVISLFEIGGEKSNDKNVNTLFLNYYIYKAIVQNQEILKLLQSISFKVSYISKEKEIKIKQLKSTDPSQKLKINRLKESINLCQSRIDRYNQELDNSKLEFENREYQIAEIEKKIQDRV